MRAITSRVSRWLHHVQEWDKGSIEVNSRIAINSLFRFVELLKKKKKKALRVDILVLLA